MKIRLHNWYINMNIGKQPSRKLLPHKYNEYIKQQKLIVLPGQFYSPTEYLEDLICQLKDDVYPLFRIHGGAPFTVTRNTLCFIDHIAQLQFGPAGKQSAKIKKVITQMGSVDAHLKKLYREYAPYLVQIYRHDLVHNVRPLPKQILVKTKLKVESRETWFYMCTECDGKSFEENLIEMSKSSSRNGRAHLRLYDVQVNIDTFSLFYDTVILLKEMQYRARTDIEFRKKITQNYYAVLERSYYSIDNFQLDQTANKQIISS